MKNALVRKCKKNLLVQDGSGALLRNSTYWVDRRTELFEVVHLMPFFIRILNGVGSNSDLKDWQKAFWSSKRMYLEDYRARYVGVTNCQRFAVLEMLENGQEIRVPETFFTKRFGTGGQYLNTILSVNLAY